VHLLVAHLPRLVHAGADQRRVRLGMNSRQRRCPPKTINRWR
jgi:hypothetical protein